MNRQIFEIYVETQLAPTLSPGDVVILDNVAFHKSKKVEQLITARRAWLLFLPPYMLNVTDVLRCGAQLAITRALLVLECQLRCELTPIGR